MSEIKLYVAHGAQPVFINANMLNRHGLIAGATGTGKTVSLQVLAEAFSAEGIPVFMADVKGDLSGIGKPGAMNKIIAARTEEFGLQDFSFQSYPVCFYDVFGKQGHPMRATISAMGPLLLSRLLNLNDTQTGTLNLVFRIADDKGLLLIDMKDLRSMLDFVGKNAKEYTTSYGTVSSLSIGAIQRGLLTLEDQGGNVFFGEPDFDIHDLMRTQGGKGVINILAADKLMQSPVLYSTLLLWMLSDLYEKLPEMGDLPKPKLVFFFDEAHLLFNDSPKVLIDKIEKIVRLIRSKGVGVYFVSQSPSDIPDNVLGQLGNRIQHALRAYTPRDQKAVKVAAQTFRPNPAINTEQVITELGVGEALVSFLDEAGRPSMVDRVIILPPHSQIGPVTEEERAEFIKKSPLNGKYEAYFDRISAFETLAEQQKQIEQQQQQQAQRSTVATGKPQTQTQTQTYSKPATKPAPVKKTTSRKKSSGTGTAVVKTVVKTLGSSQGQRLIRGLLGSLIR
jgi:DNA helicase HerA-like ATPase